MKILKPLRDIALIFYDDLEFKAMSLPRLGAGVLTAMVAVTWYQILFNWAAALSILMPLPHCAGAYGPHTLLRNGPEGGIADMMRTRQTGQKNNKMIYVAAVLIIILTAAGIWMWRDKPDPPPVVNTDTAIEELREELAASQRRIDEP